MSLRRLLAGLAAVAVVSAACGADSAGGAGDLTGYRRDPMPEVGDVELPDATADGQPMALQAAPGGVLLVYFGYTNCPDFCPTTMSDVKLALARLDEPERVSVAMVTVDPNRDFVLDPDRCADRIVLACYVTSFVGDAHALGTDDAALLSKAAAPFGAAYDVTDAAGQIEVSHTTSLYAVDDQGRLVLTWQFGVAIDDLTSDLESLLEEASA